MMASLCKEKHVACRGKDNDSSMMHAGGGGDSVEPHVWGLLGWTPEVTGLSLLTALL